IGRKVQQCHPQKSIHIVNRILDAFKNGKKDVAEFWIQKDGRMIHIRYFPVRDKNGEYLGTIEVTQDITNIKKIEGEKRLLDWKD
ncbi:MAG: PAS domain-containing protein, partial [Candidatus Aenigmatarchaeota archaeon]